MRLILASGSPRRADLLRAAGFTFDVLVTNVDERVRPGEAASAYVRRLAEEKSAAAQFGTAKATPHDATGTAKAVPYEGGLSDLSYVGHRFSGADSLSGADPGGDDDAIILGADTVVVIDGQILGKPHDDDEAASMLRQLSGRQHEVMTGISLRYGASELGRVEATAVQFNTLSDAEVAWYVASGEGRDKAGAYAIQGLASRFISRIDGSYSNVVGLPVAVVHELLSSLLASRR